jgi:hypothetical protein
MIFDILYFLEARHWVQNTLKIMDLHNGINTINAVVMENTGLMWARTTSTSGLTSGLYALCNGLCTLLS